MKLLGQVPVTDSDEPVALLKTVYYENLIGLLVPESHGVSDFEVRDRNLKGAHGTDAFEHSKPSSSALVVN